MKVSVEIADFLDRCPEMEIIADGLTRCSGPENTIIGIEKNTF